MSESNQTIDARQTELLNDLNAGAWRTPIYLELISRDIDKMPHPIKVLEIGCGQGFDGDMRLQREMARRVDQFLGVEPDQSVETQPIFARVVRSLLEDADIEPGSIDIAYSIMVMEHVAQPEPFMAALRQVLRPRGIYWGFTVDRRHWFASIANGMSKLKLKSFYLSALHGCARGHGRYLDYPTEYKLNTPEDIYRMSKQFSNVEVWNVGPVSSAGCYAPRPLRALVNTFEQRRIADGKPRTDLVVRLIR